MTKLYTMLQRDRKTGEEKVIYGHATVNVIHQYLEAYVNNENDVIIREYASDEIQLFSGHTVHGCQTCGTALCKLFTKDKVVQVGSNWNDR